MTLDVQRLRDQFPSLRSGIAHFDGPGGTQTPRQVAEAVATAMCAPMSNKGVSVASERNAAEAVAGFRAAMADLLNADPRGIVYGRSATQLTYDFSRHLVKTWSAGDEVVVCSLDHDSNIRPWVQAADRAGATVRWWEFDPTTAELSVADLEALLTPRTRLVAVTAASNLLGTMPAIDEIAAAVHRVGALLYVDGVHYAAHAVVDLPALGADFFVCSPYKFLGPHCGVLAADPDLLETVQPDKLVPSTDVVPERFEFGTLPYELMVGVTAAVDFIAGAAGVDFGAGAAPVDFVAGASGDVTGVHQSGGLGDRRHWIVSSSEQLEKHERSLRVAIETTLRSWDRVTLYSNAEYRTPTLFFTIDGIPSWEVYLELGQADILVPAGSFYASEAFARLGLTDPHGLRVGVAPYNDTRDVDRLLDGLNRIVTR